MPADQAYLDSFSRVDRLKGAVAMAIMRLRGWRDMRTAPKDGTVVLVLESPTDWAWNILPARWHTLYGPNDIDPPASHPTWWGAGWRTGYSGDDAWFKKPYGRVSAIACTPLFWRPMPKKPGARLFERVRREYWRRVELAVDRVEAAKAKTRRGQ